jgi:hypothetical protein
MRSENPVALTTPDPQVPARYRQSYHSNHEARELRVVAGRCTVYGQPDPSSVFPRQRTPETFHLATKTDKGPLPCREGNGFRRIERAKPQTGRSGFTVRVGRECDLASIGRWNRRPGETAKVEGCSEAGSLRTGSCAPEPSTIVCPAKTRRRSSPPLPAASRGTSRCAQKPPRVWAVSQPTAVAAKRRRSFASVHPDPWRCRWRSHAPERVATAAASPSAAWVRPPGSPQSCWPWSSLQTRVLPVTISYNTEPRAKMSLRLSASLPSSCSGAMY